MTSAAPHENDLSIEPFLLSILSARLNAIIREMNATLMKSSRSGVIKNSRDFSCGILTYDHRLLAAEECIPIHIAALHLATAPLTGFFDDIKPGDAFMNNCAFTGNTHHADMTLCVPVFCAGEPLFWVLARAHHADVGAPIATTYLPEAKTIFEEGIQLPCIRIREHGKDKQDIIRMIQIRNRVPELWYGDYQAQVGACATGEARLVELVEKYGLGKVKSFIAEWIEYGARSMAAEIGTLPAGSWEYTTAHDPVPGLAPDGIPVTVKLSVDPAAGVITVDMRDNIDCIPSGFNLSESTALAACRTGVFYCLDPELPHNEGSASRIRVLLRDGCVVGRPSFPMGTSVATTNVASRVISAVSACFAQMGSQRGMGEMGYSQTLGEAVISGTDPTRGDIAYINQIFVGVACGAALHGHDGWLLSGAGCDGGQIALDSIEVDESMYPILVETRKISIDTGGAGEFEGAPGIEGCYRPLGHQMTAFWGSDGDINPARGVRGGGDAAVSSNGKRLATGQVERLAAFGGTLIGPHEALVFQTCGGGGYGNPASRPVHKILAAVNAGWISPARARDIYGVAIAEAETGDGWREDVAQTAVLRAKRLAGD